MPSQGRPERPHHSGVSHQQSSLHRVVCIQHCPLSREPQQPQLHVHAADASVATSATYARCSCVQHITGDPGAYVRRSTWPHACQLLAGAHRMEGCSTLEHSLPPISLSLSSLSIYLSYSLCVWVCVNTVCTHVIWLQVHAPAHRNAASSQAVASQKGSTPGWRQQQQEQGAQPAVFFAAATVQRS